MGAVCGEHVESLGRMSEAGFVMVHLNELSLDVAYVCTDCVGLFCHERWKRGERPMSYSAFSFFTIKMCVCNPRVAS